MTLEQTIFERYALHKFKTSNFDELKANKSALVKEILKETNIHVDQTFLYKV